MVRRSEAKDQVKHLLTAHRKPPNKISDVLKLVRAVLAAPQPDDAVEAGIADQAKNDKKGFEKTAQDWTKKYAK